MPAKTIVAAALAFAINFTESTTSVYAQAASHESQQTSTADPSELAPAPTTWKGAFTDSIRLLLVLNPSRTLSNSAQGRAPWSRAVRPLR